MMEDCLELLRTHVYLNDHGKRGRAVPCLGRRFSSSATSGLLAQRRPLSCVRASRYKALNLDAFRSISPRRTGFETAS